MGLLTFAGRLKLRQSVRLTRVCTVTAEGDFPSTAGKAHLRTNFCNSLRTAGQHIKGLLLSHSATPGDTLSTISRSAVAGASVPTAPAREFRAHPTTDSDRMSVHASRAADQRGPLHKRLVPCRPAKAHGS